MRKQPHSPLVDHAVPPGTPDEQTAWIRTRIAANLEGGDPQPFDLEAVKSRGRQKLVTRRAA